MTKDGCSQCRKSFADGATCEHLRERIRQINGANASMDAPVSDDYEEFRREHAECAKAMRELRRERDTARAERDHERRCTDEFRAERHALNDDNKRLRADLDAETRARLDIGRDLDAAREQLATAYEQMAEMLAMADDATVRAWARSSVLTVEGTRVREFLLGVKK